VPPAPKGAGGYLVAAAAGQVPGLPGDAEGASGSRRESSAAGTSVDPADANAASAACAPRIGKGTGRAPGKLGPGGLPG
jgi:hypothetical protein